MTSGQFKNHIDLVYPELCYKVVGVLFSVHNELGHGHAEKVYQRAVAVSLRKMGLSFVEQLYVPTLYQGEKVGTHYLDFFIEGDGGNVVLEIKKGDHFSKSHIDQVYQYLVSKDLKLGILAYFAPRGVHYKRIVNIKN